MIELGDVSLDEVLVFDVAKLLFTLPHGLDQQRIRCLLVHNLCLTIGILSLGSFLGLEGVVLSEISQLLLQHRLMIPILDILLNLSLRSLQLLHDLLVTLLDGLTIVTLSLQVDLIVLPPRILEFHPLIIAVLVDGLQTHSIVSLLGLVSLEVVLEVELLRCPM